MPRPAPQDSPAVAALAAGLAGEGELDALASRLAAALRQTDLSYLAVPAEELQRSIRANLRDLLTDLAEQRTLRSGASGRTAGDTARRRAAQGVPLGSVLHAYRLGFQTVWAALADRALRAGPEQLHALMLAYPPVLAWADSGSELVGRRYREAVADAARQDEQRRDLLLDALFDGRSAERRPFDSRPPDLHPLELPARGTFVAVSAEAWAARSSTEGSADALPGVAGHLRRHGLASAWRLRPHELLGLVAVDRRQDEESVRELLTAVVADRVGLSPRYEGVLDTGRAVLLAAAARRTLAPGTAEVATIHDDPVATLVAGAPEFAVPLARRLLGGIRELPPDEQELLMNTLRIWLRCGGDGSAAARRLYCHRNTVRNRLIRVERLTGSSLADPRGAARLAVAAECLRLHGVTG